MESFLRIFFCLTFTGFLFACSDSSTDSSSSNSGQITWRFALEEVEGSVQDAYAKEFKRRIETLSGGQITIEVYPYGTLGTSSQLTELIQGSALELGFASPGHLASVIPEVGVFTLHFVLSDNNDINKEVLSSTEVQGPLKTAYQSQGLSLLSIVPEGWMVWTGDKALNSPDEFSGFKIRTMTSPILVESYKAYGANPTPLPYSEVYSGLQLGQIDGQVNPIFAIEEMSFYEEQDVMTMARHAQFVSTVIAGSQWQQQLPQQQQQWLQQTVTEMVDWIYEKQATYNAERLQLIIDAGGTEVVELNEAQREAFRQQSFAVRDLYIEQAGNSGEKLLTIITDKITALESIGQ